jgi:glutamate/tyrosine decarboxylase-like PLP-dependent enzyme
MTGKWLDEGDLTLLSGAFETLTAGFHQHGETPMSVDERARLAEILDRVATRLHNSFPFGDPLYAGQMLKPPHPIARLAYTLALWINANNHALDGGPASSLMEKEAIAQIAAMFEWNTPWLGHLCAGGTMANLEALWVAGRLAPGGVILASSQAHYTHGRISEVLGLPFEALVVDGRGRIRLDALEQRLVKGDVACVVATAGTTGLGAVDPVADIRLLCEEHGVRLHADAAYGGYFVLAGTLAPDTRRALAGLTGADSIVIDPHKHGLQPYGCGCVLFRDPSVGRFYQHDSPYTYFSSDELHLGEISLECSRAGASAVALWATMMRYPLVSGGEFAAGLDACHAAAVSLYEWLEASDRWLTLTPPELDIVVWAPRGATLSAVSAASEKVFRNAAEQKLHLAKIVIPIALLPDEWAGVEHDQPTVTCLRSTLMKWEHGDWIEEMEKRLVQASAPLAD